MLSIAAGLFMLGLMIHLFGLSGVFPTKRFPYAMDTPCMLSFIVLGIIFLNLGIIYRDMAVNPELLHTKREKKPHLKDEILEDTEPKRKTEKESWKKREEEGEEIKEIIDAGGID